METKRSARGQGTPVETKGSGAFSGNKGVAEIRGVKKGSAAGRPVICGISACSNPFSKGASDIII